MNVHFLPFTSILKARMHLILTIDHTQKIKRYMNSFFNPSLFRAFSMCFDTHDISEGISYSCMGLHLDILCSNYTLIA